MFHVEQNLVFLFKLSTINILNIIYIGRVPGCRLCGTAPEVPPRKCAGPPNVLTLDWGGLLTSTVRLILP